MGIQQTTSTPFWPQGNAEVEAFMKPLGKAIRTANVKALEGRIILEFNQYIFQPLSSVMRPGADCKSFHKIFRHP